MLFAARWEGEKPEIIFIHPPGRLNVNEIGDILGLTLKERLPDVHPRKGFYFFSLPRSVFSGLMRDIVVYYSVEPKILVGLLLDKKDNPQLYRGALMWVCLEYFAQERIPNRDEIEIIWKKINKYPSMSFEQRMIDIFADEIVRIILDELRKDGYMNVYEMARRVFNKMTTPITIEVIRDYLGVLEAHGIIKMDFNPVSLEEIIYLIYDMAIVLRKPKYLKKVLKKHPEVKDHIHNIIQEYKEKWEDFQVRTAKVLENPFTFEILLSLRNNPLKSTDLNNDEYIRSISSLQDLGLVIKYDDIYYLILDPTILLITPEKTLKEKTEFVLSLTSHMRSVETVLISEWLEKISKSEL